MIPVIEEEVKELMSGETEANLELREEEKETTRTYKLSIIGGKKMIYGYCDELEAIKQAVQKILSTERYEHVIYSDDYGVELKNLIGEPVNYVIPELERRITEAVMIDNRIENVDNFDFYHTTKGLLVEFMVYSVFGNLQVKKEVVLNV